jgi:hypothetical protein
MIAQVVVASMAFRAAQMAGALVPIVPNHNRNRNLNRNLT